MKYIAASNAVKMTVWLRKFIDELGVVLSINGPVLLYCNSTGAIAQAKKLKFHQRTKHILHRYHLIREIMERGDIELQKIDEKKKSNRPLH